MIVTDKKFLNRLSGSVLFFERSGIFKKLLVEIILLPNAVGLAAVQIGILKKAFIMRLLNGGILKVSNPEILSVSDEKIIVPEGCLSFPGKLYSVVRSIRIVYKDDSGKHELSGVEAQVFQHEFDHLLGITLPDKEVKTAGVGRNEPCPCGSGKKYKKCCLK